MCPDEMELSRFLARSLPGARTRALEDHFDLCRDCRQLVFALAGLDPALETLVRLDV
ncbi:MAG: hypothetical protein H0T42_21645 [Deltaproteobacteria bacterium]|nr:hypothetical protein [Deltaproteobacteria bacterium]